MFCHVHGLALLAFGLRSSVNKAPVFRCPFRFVRLVSRAIMGLASKEKLWQVSLLLVEHLKRSGLVPGKFVYDEICSVSTGSMSSCCCM